MFGLPPAPANGAAVDPFGSLPPWDPPGHISTGFDQFLDSVLPSLDDSAFEAKGAEAQVYEGDIASTVSGRKDSGERKRARNNLAQKRHRDRKKEQSQQLEAQYAASTAELEELKKKQKSLEARNLLLEKLMQMSKKAEPSTSAPTTADDMVPDMLRMWDKFQSIPEPFARVVARSPLKLTVHKDKEQIIQISELTKLSPKFFQGLHADYCTAFGQCLIEQEGDNSSTSPARMRLRALVVEWKQLMVSLVLSMPARLHVLGSENQSLHGSIDKAPAEPSNFYPKFLTAVELTDSQIADILHLRQLLYCKQGQLARERKALLSRMASVNAGAIERVGEKFSQLTQCSEALRLNGAEEYRIWVEFSGAYHAGIMTTEQTAKAMVYSYPYWPKHGLVMEHLAKERGQPSMQALLDDTSVDDLQHAANWEQVVRYASTITMETIHDHVCLLPS